MAKAIRPSLFPFNVDITSEACDFEIINNKPVDEDKCVKDGGAER